MTGVTQTAEAMGDTAFFGHPRPLSTLFLTEMWERFSFYGMRAILILFLTATVANGGMGLSTGTATALYGLYVGMVYLTALPGGWIADRLIGARRSVLYGGIIIALGHYVLAVPANWTVFLGLILIVVGTGLLKPNISSMVGNLYEKDSAKRDAGFSLFYMGINLGAFIAPLITGWLADNYSYHAGFAAAAIGMTFAVIQYIVGSKRLRENGAAPTYPLVGAARKSAFMKIGIGVAVAVVVFALMGLLGWLSVDSVVNVLAGFTVAVAVVYFARIFLDKGLTEVERSRMKAYVWLFIFAAAFWLIYDQAGSVLNTFADEQVDRTVGGYTFPAAWLQSVNPILVIIGAPLAGALWLKLGHRVSTPWKFAVGLIFNGLSFMLMAAAAAQAVGGNLVSPLWLVAVYALQVAGELALSPVGLSATTKLAPANYAGQMLGLWFLATAVGDAIGGQVGRLAETWSQTTYFLTFGLASAVLGLAALMFAKSIKTLMRGIH
ncbi:POT family proton-dependent oligopeptide transporter [Allocatelliglobosispora scoriae]|uniref:POT family proton-dependent oligopeptide transporter n=2 Tax=Allocatelliglobosispora scoriae TaxID=643052 RepID=A0A841C0Q3_9ACTN|nr:peptide MFS transporter [Allocatelliglobosispora scoriae]MBB5873954.1 POT family proton-dependent oligopeptide transporter [Allocatelliglobosispora scoriae]